MSVGDLPTLNALLNATSAVLLFIGRNRIKNQKPDQHKKFMIAALISSTLFFISYGIYHRAVGSVPYPHHDWTRPLYFAILIPHTILATVMTPFIVTAVVFALKGKFEKHRKIVRRLWPVWIFVSISGIAVYLMLYKW